MEKTDQRVPATQVVNPATLDRLREMGGDHFVVEMIEALCTFAPKVMLEARTGLVAGQLEPVVRMGHSLKSSARLLGAETMQELAVRIEICARQGTAETLPGLLDELDGAYFRAKEYLLKVRDNGGKPF